MRVDPCIEVLEDYEHPAIRFANTQSPMQLDVFIPSLRVAFEYHGKHHFEDTMIFGLSRQYSGSVFNVSFPD